MYRLSVQNQLTRRQELDVETLPAGHASAECDLKSKGVTELYSL